MKYTVKMDKVGLVAVFNICLLLEVLLGGFGIYWLSQGDASGVFTLVFCLGFASIIPILFKKVDVYHNKLEVFTGYRRKKVNFSDIKWYKISEESTYMGEGLPSMENTVLKLYNEKRRKILSISLKWDNSKRLLKTLKISGVREMRK